MTLVGVWGHCQGETASISPPSPALCSGSPRQASWSAKTAGPGETLEEPEQALEGSFDSRIEKEQTLPPTAKADHDDGHTQMTHSRR